MDDNLYAHIRTLEIDKGVPLRPKRGLTPEYKYFSEVLNEMENGDSIVVDTPARAVAIRAQARRMGICLTQRKEPDGRLRLWRVENVLADIDWEAPL